MKREQAHPRKSLQLRRALRNFVARYPGLYLPIRSLKRPMDTVSDRTDIVIEGFPRSGNTLTEFVIRSIQTRSLSIAHHSHSPSQVIRGVNLGIPTLLVVREPISTVVSLVAHSPRVYTVNFALNEYIGFHKMLLPLKEALVVLTIHSVVEHLGEVTAHLNEKYNLGLKAAQYAEVESEALSLMNARGVGKGSDVNGLDKSNPNRDKMLESAIRDQALTLFHSGAYEKKIRRANEIYELMIQQCLFCHR